MPALKAVPKPASFIHIQEKITFTARTTTDSPVSHSTPPYSGLRHILCNIQSITRTLTQHESQVIRNEKWIGQKRKSVLRPANYIAVKRQEYAKYTALARLAFYFDAAVVGLYNMLGN
jgi:hypothetical protein